MGLLSTFIRNKNSTPQATAIFILEFMASSPQSHHSLQLTLRQYPKHPLAFLAAVGSIWTECVGNYAEILHGKEKVHTH